MSEKEKLEELIAELKAIEELIAELKAIEVKLAEVSELEKRRNELRGDRCSRDSGEITEAKIAYEDSLNPIFKEAGKRSCVLRIVSVDSKWISLKYDGIPDTSTTRYKISNGWPEESRDGYGAIDIELALKIWNRRSRQN
jgi:hypothetical protein